MTVLGPKTRIAGRYDLLEPITSSRLGRMWRAEDCQLQRPVAVLLVHPELAADEQFRTTFETEARGWASISHPGATWVFDFGHHTGDGGAPLVYLVRELVEGERLDDVLSRRSPLSPIETLDLVAQAASTLHAAHGRGIVHGDVSPANLILRTDGVLKVTNFCVARAVDAAPLLHAHVALDGTAQRSPEQAAGQPPTPASDIYGLGTVAYQCLAGSEPFTAEGPVSMSMAHLTEAPAPLPASVPDDAADLLHRMLAKDPAGRPTDAATVATEAVAACHRLGGRTTMPLRDLLGGDAVRMR